MSPKIERLTESFLLGEGPHWDVATQSLYFLDCIRQNLVKYNPATNKVTTASAAPKQPTFIIPVQGKSGQFIISLDKELAIINWDGQSDKFSIVRKLCVADGGPGTAQNKFNDGKCDSSGRLWAGTLNIDKEDEDKTLPLGTLYSFDSKRGLKGHVNQVRLTNGIAFNDQTKKMFYIDTLKGTVDQFDFDVTNGEISNRKVWFTLTKNNISGKPDGMTIDTDGNLWVAVFMGSRVIKIDGHTAETLLDTVEIPAQQVTSVAFGGQNLDELYVTTASFEYKGRTPPPPVNGALYRITGTGSKGLPANNFKLD
ncbi:regucalcin [Tribolium castaneum]|uniref:Regucalcin n=1 Tax=Tribolium castaneum TaxID=7070 RepID=D6WJC7_TRICA|nr:PREDICTED: regucalcin [Tribolium castaneum]EFA03135.1 Regucalcin-like Protein [Tribolium castaneum]|eukprot:XP_008194065.1 PREDICTED: regucalcin [Tribolium castaneum]